MHEYIEDVRLHKNELWLWCFFEDPRKFTVENIDFAMLPLDCTAQWSRIDRETRRTCCEYFPTFKSLYIRIMFEKRCTQNNMTWNKDNNEFWGFDSISTVVEITFSIDQPNCSTSSSFLMPFRTWYRGVYSSIVPPVLTPQEKRYQLQSLPRLYSSLHFPVSSTAEPPGQHNVKEMMPSVC
ncbi:unnamed protein product [Lepeophtheirus salmonis]|uniref:(salmon louse) hypothetical protein n=1 Tax=Lepeophtheirus salmonis TaxID=72036 RepID=A0A7R8CLM0_LEPSM|nr:unnamed protein product [Lepeophtheirus salmonis]CAF2859814.1 unnamed protein product [Lepeophtheirus salmonis]